MNNPEPSPDPLERRMQEQPLRQPPAAWRQDILNAALAGRHTTPAAVPTARDARSRLPWHELLQAWLRPRRLAWASLAALWLATAVLHSFGRYEPLAHTTLTADTPRSFRAALTAHRRELTALLGDEGSAPAPGEAAPANPGGRRSAAPTAHRLT